MGAVYLATHLGTGRAVALKVLAPELIADDDAIEQFKREALLAGRIRHPNVVDVTDFGFAARGDERFAYLVMELLGGQTLRARLDTSGPLPLDLAMDVLGQNLRRRLRGARARRPPPRSQAGEHQPRAADARPVPRQSPRFRDREAPRPELGSRRRRGSVGRRVRLVESKPRGDGSRFGEAEPAERGERDRRRRADGVRGGGRDTALHRARAVAGPPSRRPRRRLQSGRPRVRSARRPSPVPWEQAVHRDGAPDGPPAVPRADGPLRPSWGRRG